MRKRMIVSGFLGMLILSLCSCGKRDIMIGPHDPAPLSTAPSTVTELVVSLSDPDHRARLAAIYALRDMGSAAEPAVPALIAALSDTVSDVRVAAADALGEIGPKAAPAVPALIEVLRSDDFVHARVSAAEALGKIGDVSAVPALADILWDQEAREEDISIPIKAAQAIAQLTDNSFPDSGPGSHGYRLNDDGEPLIVIAAQEWWQNKGMHQEWPAVSDKQQR